MELNTNLQARFARRNYILALITVSFVAAVFYPSFSLNHDSSWYLVATDRFLDGARLYDAIIEINPPLAFYLTVPPVAAARLFGSDPTATYFWYCIALGFVSSFWSLKIVAGAALPNSERAGLFLAIIAALFVLPVSEFGQREHLMLIFAMPFLMLQVLRDRLPNHSLSVELSAGLFASFGFMLKPHFLIIPATVGLLRIWQDRNFRIFFDPAFLMMAFAAIAYVLFIATVHPEYLNFIVPMATQVYESVGMQPSKIIARPEIVSIILIGLVAWRTCLINDTCFQTLAVITLSSAVVYLIQFKGWNYHLLPFSTFLMITTFWALVHRSELLRENTTLLAYSGLALTIILAIQFARGPYESVTKPEFARFVDREGESILVLSTNVWASFPFINEVSATWASRYPHQWLIPGAHDRLMFDCNSTFGDHCVQSREILTFARSSILDDIQRFQPDLIYVDENKQKAYFRDPNFDYFEFLSEDARFRTVRSCYRRIGDARGFGVFSNICGLPSS